MNITIYGIKNCDTMKKALIWLDEQGIKYTFHDYKKQGITDAKLNEWLKHIAPDKLINTKGTTFKKLTPEQQSSITKPNLAIELMLSNPSMIKRPLVEFDGNYTLGFDANVWADLLK